MRTAFDVVWNVTEVAAKDAELPRLLLAALISHQVDAGVIDQEQVVATAIGALAVAKNVSGERLVVKSKSVPEVK
jgi:hypothetical protein